MQSFLAIVRLTLKAAFRSRLVLITGLLLFAGVVLLPLVVRDDGTARGLTQIILTYTLILASALLGLATLWMACGSLSRDIEECQIQMVAVKPVARWKIWLGKWFGITLMNVAWLLLSGVAVYGLLEWRARQLPEDEMRTLQEEVLVARGSARPEVPDIEPLVDRAFEERIKDERVAEMDREFVRDQIRAGFRARLEYVPPGYRKPWSIDLGRDIERLKDQPVFLRVKFYVPPENSTTLEPDTYINMWEIGPPGSPKTVRLPVEKRAAETFHEIAIPPNLFDENGVLTVAFYNSNPIALLFRAEDGIEVLYREGGFALNFIRGLLIIVFWMGLLAAVGLAASSFLSFPVAAFFCAAVLVVGFSGGVVSTVVDQGAVFGADHEGNPGALGWLNPVMVPMFTLLNYAVRVPQEFAPIDLLSSGRSVSWGMLLRAAGWILGVIGGVFAAFGIWVFTRRELAGQT